MSLSPKTIEVIVITTILIGAFFILGLTIGYQRGQSTLSADKMMPNDGMAVSHVHERRDVTEPYPAVALEVIKDSKMGWNIFIKTENYVFAPEAVNTEYQPGVGHAHLYVNGERITRLYGPWYYLKELPPGRNIVTVALSGNDHSELYADDKMIQATYTIVVE